MADHGKPHLLVIEDVEGERKWRVRHPPTCPWDAWKARAGTFPFEEEDQDGRLAFHRVCYVQFELDHNGLDSLEIHSIGPDYDLHLDPDVKLREFEPDWCRLRPGRYRVQAWYDPPSAPLYEGEGGLYLLDLVPAPEPDYNVTT